MSPKTRGQYAFNEYDIFSEFEKDQAMLVAVPAQFWRKTANIEILIFGNLIRNFQKTAKN